MQRPDFSDLFILPIKANSSALRNYLRAKELNAELLRSQRLEQNVLHDMCYSVVLWDWIFFNQSHGQAVTTDHLRIQKRSKNKSPAIALFLFVGYILSFVIRFIVNAPDSLLIKHELDLEGFKHQDSLDRISKYVRVRV